MRKIIKDFLKGLTIHYNSTHFMTFCDDSGIFQNRETHG